MWWFLLNYFKLDSRKRFQHWFVVVFNERNYEDVSSLTPRFFFEFYILQCFLKWTGFWLDVVGGLYWILSFILAAVALSSKGWLRLAEKKLSCMYTRIHVKTHFSFRNVFSQYLRFGCITGLIGLSPRPNGKRKGARLRVVFRLFSTYLQTKTFRVR